MAAVVEAVAIALVAQYASHAEHKTIVCFVMYDIVSVYVSVRSSFLLSLLYREKIQTAKEKMYYSSKFESCCCVKLTKSNQEETCAILVLIFQVVVVIQ